MSQHLWCKHHQLSDPSSFQSHSNTSQAYTARSCPPVPRRYGGEGTGGGGRGRRVGVLVLVLAGTRPVVSGARLSVHARPKAWECGVYRQCLSRSSPRIIFVSALAACRVPGPPVLRTAHSGVLAGSWTRSPIMGEESYYGGPLAELHHLQCRWHVHMVCWDCCPVVRAFSFLGYTRA